MQIKKQQKALYITAAIIAVVPFLGISYVMKTWILVLLAAFIAYTAYTLSAQDDHDASSRAFEEHKPEDTHGA